MSEIVGKCHLPVLETRGDLGDQDVIALERRVPLSNFGERSLGLSFDTQCFFGHCGHGHEADYFVQVWPVGRSKFRVNLGDYIYCLNRPLHPSNLSNSLRPFAMSASNAASRPRITFGGSYSTASYATSL